MKRLCCMLDPYIVCIRCLAPSCETCSSDEARQHCTKGCDGIWYPIYHEAVTDPERRKKYILILDATRPR